MGTGSILAQTLNPQFLYLCIDRCERVLYIHFWDPGLCSSHFAKKECKRNADWEDFWRYSCFVPVANFGIVVTFIFIMSNTHIYCEVHFKKSNLIPCTNFVTRPCLSFLVLQSIAEFFLTFFTAASSSPFGRFASRILHVLLYNVCFFYAS